jgi:protein-tyrosine phosphatase
MTGFRIYPLTMPGGGLLALSPLPGRSGEFARDLDSLLHWQPDLVFSMTTQAEMQSAGAAELGQSLRAAKIDWCHLPITDFGAPTGQTARDWPDAARKAHAALTRGGRILIHCKGGRGRSGMAALRLMLERGETPQAALGRLRAIRPGAVETAAQMHWATKHR